MGQNSSHSQKAKVSRKQRKKTQDETQKCINFGVSSSFTLSFYVSLPCALIIGSLSPVPCDRIATLSMSEKCFKLQVRRFKLQMWSVKFLSERQLLWTRNAWNCELWMWRFKLRVWSVKFLNERVWGSSMNGLGLEFLS